MKDFRVTGESGVKIFSEDFFDSEVKPELDKIFTEAIDYENGIRLSLQFSRPGKLDYKDALELLYKESAADTVKKIEFLAARLRKALT